MQILTFLILLPFLGLLSSGYGGCECSGIGNDMNAVRRIRAAGISTLSEEIKQTLKNASQLSAELANAAEQFADLFNKKKPEDLIKIFKGFSLAGSFAASFFADPQDKNTKTILTTLDNRFRKMTNQLRDHTIQIKTAVDQNDFILNVVDRLSGVSKTISAYREQPSPDGLTEFSRVYCEARLTNVGQHIIRSAKDFYKHVMEVTRFNKKKFDETRSYVTRHLFQLYAIEFFALGLKYKPEFQEGPRQFLNELFRQDKKELEAISKEATEVFMSSYFPGFIKEDVVEKIIDQGGDMCEMSKKIIETLTSMFPWNKYAVAITQMTTRLTDFAYHPVPGRAMKVDYKDKRVVIFISSKNAKENKAAFEAEGALDLITKETKKTSIRFAFTLLDYARHGNRSIQQAVFTTDNCMDFSNANVGTAWQIKMPYPTPFTGPFHRYYMMVIF